MNRPTATLIFVLTVLTGSLSGAAWATAIADVSEIGTYTQIYQLNIPDNAAFDTNAVPYTVDNSGTPIAINRIAYYLELGTATSTQWIWVSMDAFTQNLTQIGVPTLSSGAQWQMTIDNMNVESNVAVIATGTGISTGNIEFWPYDYAPQAALAGIGGSGNNFDFNDTNEQVGNYGSMQIHNWGTGQTLFAYSGWGGNPAFSVDDVGIGNSSGTNPDWTFAQNADGFTLKSLEVWVQPVPVPAAVYLFGSGLLGLAGIARRRAA